ncbi:uncharacterized protein C7orf57 homolog isoform X2 [Bombina bombina]|uniref:uncharacterized protein C7orf57 homolog isoform X2 n=1 Tax=Bombina bombina TaxID=8345 RepID=UPI00235B2BEE|nr:uncharacterized protein C7orf57 homolog isoform X2 [Bombina bombina]
MVFTLLRPCYRAHSKWSQQLQSQVKCNFEFVTTHCVVTYRGEVNTADWYYNAPLKKMDKEESEVAIPPTSQIPGLGDMSESDEHVNEGRRHCIMDTDSDYVKLAKQGGRPDLLKQSTPVPRKASEVSHGLPEWYTHESPVPEAESSGPYMSHLPDYMTHKETETEENEIKYEGKRGPFDFDQQSYWQRKSDNGKENVDHKKVKLPAIKSSFVNEPSAEKGPPIGQGKLAKKCFFPPMPQPRNAENVNFSKLMGNGYGNDWYQQREDKEKSLQDPETCQQE